MRIKKITSLVLGLLLTVVLATPASASVRKNEITQPETNMSIEELDKLFDENNVPDDKREVLISKLENGVLWDCYDDTKLKSVPEDFSNIDISELGREKVFRFEDGSFMSISVAPGENSEVQRNVLPITQDGAVETSDISERGYGNTYVNYLVKRHVGGQKAYFYASFFVSDYNSSMIYTSANSNGVYNSPFGDGVEGFGTTGNASMKTIRDRESYGQAAMHRMFWYTQVTVGGDWGGVNGSITAGGTCNLYLGLTNSTISITSKVPFV